MLLKRIAKSRLRSQINSYINIEKYEALPKNLAAKKAFKSKSRKEILNDLTFDVKYCLDETANPDEDYIKTLKELLEKCKKKDTSNLQDFLIKLK